MKQHVRKNGAKRMVRSQSNKVRWCTVARACFSCGYESLSHTLPKNKKKKTCEFTEGWFVDCDVHVLDCIIGVFCLLIKVNKEMQYLCEKLFVDYINFQLFLGIFLYQPNYIVAIVCCVLIFMKCQKKLLLAT